jgi:hypothetical protein
VFQIGSYFGSALCSLDVDGDRTSDLLLVGAPMFMSELKNLQASGLTTLGHALRTAFDLLNLNRLVSGIDNYGQV